MATTFSSTIQNQTFYNANTLRNLEFWTLAGGASIITGEGGKVINLPAGGSAAYNLSNDVGNALLASRLRRLILEIHVSPYSDVLELINKVEFRITGAYDDEDETRFYVSVPAAKTGYAIVGDDYSRIDIPIELENRNIKYAVASIRNISQTSSSVYVSHAALYRSQDVTQAQVSESIDFSVVLNQVIAYQDGCELYFGDTTQPDKLYYLSDTSGKFAGVRVVPGNGGDTRIIKFQRIDKPLT